MAQVTFGMDDLRVGFVGLGRQGAPMAARIAESGLPLTVWARRPETLRNLEVSRATVASSLVDLAGAVDVVGICVNDDTDVEQVVLGGVLDSLPTGGVVAVHSTVLPRTCQRLATFAADHGVAVIDAPVYGGGPAAAAGELAVSVGGDAIAVERYRPVLATFANLITHVGPVGAGSVVKLLWSNLFTARLQLVTEAVDAAVAMGLDQVTVSDFLTFDERTAFIADTIAGRRSTEALSHMHAMLVKDVSHLIRVALDHGRDLGRVELAARAGLNTISALAADVRSTRKD